MTHPTQTGFSSQSAAGAKSIWFDRRELDQILWTYGKLVSAGECRDYAIGAFLKAAQAKPWFKDTVFVIVAD